MLSKIVRTFLWVLIHILYTILENILVLWVYIDLKIKEFRRLRSSKDSFDYVSCSMISGGKIPQHVVLILDEDNISYHDLARLIIWSLAAGISYFSFYDKSGVLIKNEDKLLEAVQQQKLNAPGRIKWKNQLDLNGYKNGTSHTIIVNLIRDEDGKHEIVSTVRSICEETKDGSIDPSHIDINYLDKQLNNHRPPVPDPNLAIYCGKTLRVYGLSPWHIRLTEFSGLVSHRDVKVEQFVDILQKYMDCQQRFGK